MGNTILAHALYACSQADLDLNTFFSDTGNAHAVPSNKQLTAKHLKKFPSNYDVCVLELVCNNWDKILRFKMGYSKWAKEVPTHENLEKFFEEINLPKTDTLWDNAYDALKGSEWPSNPGYYKRQTLPPFVLKEMESADVEASLKQVFLEKLLITYYDLLNQKESATLCNKELSLEDYLDGNYSILKLICEEQLGWYWDDEKDALFFQKVHEVNSEYFIWLKRIKDAVLAIEFQNFEPWEQALIAAKACKDLNLDVRGRNIVLDKLFKNI